MFPVSKAVFSACDGAHEVRSDDGCTPVTALCSFYGPPRLAVWTIPLLALVLCLALPGAGWAAMPIDEPPVGSQSAPRAIQAVTWSGFTPTGWVAAPFMSTITASSPAGLESGDAYQVSQDGGATWSVWSTSGLSTSIPVSSTHNISVTGLTFPDSATQNLIRFRTYETGNIEALSPSYIVKVDTTLPASTATWTPPLPASGWYTTSVTFSFAATDLPEDLSFPPLVYTSLNGGVWKPFTQLVVATEGSQSLRYQARDKAGNMESITTIAFGIDKTPPTVSLAADRLPNASGWYTASVTHTLSLSDSVSGEPVGYYRLNDGDWQTGTGFTLATDGNYQVEAYGQDKAGNRSAIVTKAVHVDATAPVTAWAIDGTLGDNDWYVSDVTVRLLPADNVSGVAQTQYRINETGWKTGLQFLMADDGIYNVSYASVDTAGNAELPVTRQVKIDTTAPGAPTAIQASPAVWTRTNAFDVTWTPPGDLSGVAGAYYKLGAAPTGPRDGVFISGTAGIENLAVPAEGVYRLYLWSRDKAGNVDHTTASAQGPLLRYDATAPTTVIQVDGNVGSNGWYRSPVDVTLSAADSASGISALRYRVNGGEWQLTSNATVSLAFSEAGNHLVECYAQDVAGNVEAVKTSALNLDFTAPVPLRVNVLPELGSAINSFRLEWPPVEDLSGVAGAYVRFGSPPSGPTDGTYYAGVDAVEGVEVPGEGRHTAYVWLVDAAGNLDPLRAVVLRDALRYDTHPPATVVTPTAALGLNGWYVEPVTFAMFATDATSGVREVLHEVDDGGWVSSGTFIYGEDGYHTISIKAIDNAGNEEIPRGYPVAIDHTPPQAFFTGPGSTQSDTSFEVTWSGADSANGSGLASYDVEVRDGYDAGWEAWLQETQLTSTQFNGQRGHTHFFRVFARDRAGNRQLVGGTTRVLVQPVLNGGFDNVFGDWTTGGQLPEAVGWTPGPDGEPIQAAHLGSEDYYGPQFEDPGSIPQDSSTISQVITIPPRSQVQWPALTFWYRVQTYDVMYSQTRQRDGDTFDVKLCAVGTLCTGPYAGKETKLLLRDGNPMNGSVWWDLYKGAPPLYDTGWKAAQIDLRQYAGQTLQFVFANENRIDNKYNTWSYVAEIRIVDLRRTFAPLISVPGVRAAAAAIEPPQEAGPLTVESEESVR